MSTNNHGRDRGGRTEEDRGLQRATSGLGTSRTASNERGGTRRSRAAMSSRNDSQGSYSAQFEADRRRLSVGSSTSPHEADGRRRSSTSKGSQGGQRDSRGSRDSQGSYGSGSGSSSGDPRLLCVLDVAYARDKSDRIAIPMGADAALLATEFAAKHGLESSQIRTLEDFIQRTILEHMAARTSALDDDEEDTGEGTGEGEGTNSEWEEGAAERAAPGLRSPLLGEEEEHTGSEYEGEEGKRHRQQSTASSLLYTHDERRDWVPPAVERPQLDIDDSPYTHAAPVSSSSGPAAMTSSSDGPSTIGEDGEALYTRLKSAWKSAGKGGGSGGGSGAANVNPVLQRARAEAQQARRGATTRTSTKAGKLGGSGGKGSAFSRLYEEAEMMKKRQQDARDRKAKMEEKEMREKQWTMPAKTRRIIEQYLSAQASDDSTNVGERLHRQAMTSLKDREGVTDRAKKEMETKIDDWVCPRCSHVNPWDEEACQKVTGRTKPMIDQVPSAWVYMNEGTRLSSRGIGGMGGRGEEEVLRCQQPRPASLYTPTITSLQDYQSVYMAPLPVSVRYRPENIYEDLFARRAEIEQRRRTLCCQRWDEEKVDCTFRPEINEHSKALLEERDRYYAEAEAAGNLEEVAMHKAMMRQRLHAKCIAEEDFPYRPDIGVSQYANRVETPQQLIERLAIEDPKKRTQKVEAISKYVLKLEGTYHPRINPGNHSGPSSVERRLEGKYASVCEYLYEQRHVIKQKKEAAQRKTLQEIEEQANMRYTKDLSSKLVHEMKARAYEHIFRSLFRDPLNATTLSSLVITEADLSAVPTQQLLETLTHVLTSPPLPPSGRLGFLEFCARMDRAVLSLGDLLIQPCAAATEEKSRYLLDQNKELTFHPLINPRSADKARERWTNPELMYNVLHREREMIIRRREEKKRQQEEDEVKAYSFKPQLTPYRHGAPRYHMPCLAFLSDDERRDLGRDTKKPVTKKPASRESSKPSEGRPLRLNMAVVRAGSPGSTSSSSSANSSPPRQSSVSPPRRTSVSPPRRNSYMQPTIASLHGLTPPPPSVSSSSEDGHSPPRPPVVNARRGSYLKGYLDTGLFATAADTLGTQADGAGHVSDAAGHSSDIVTGEAMAAALAALPPPPPPPLPSDEDVRPMRRRSSASRASDVEAR